MSAGWVEHALCREVGPSLFERADDDDTGGGHAYNDGRKVCLLCPVRALCLDEAMRMEGDLHHSARTGMWGGMAPKQRARYYPTWRLEAAA